MEIRFASDPGIACVKASYMGKGDGGGHSWNGGLTVQTSVDDGANYITRERDEGAAKNLDANYFPLVPSNRPQSPPQPPSPPFSPAPQHCALPSSGECGGNDAGNHGVVEDLDACKEVCAQTTGCNFYTWWEPALHSPGHDWYANCFPKTAYCEDPNPDGSGYDSVQHSIQAYSMPCD